MVSTETLRGFVNAWECDENDHLNVKFYVRFFADAALHFMALHGAGPQARPPALIRHVRFHSEMLSGQLVRAESHPAPAETPGRWHLVHRLSEPATGRLTATAVDTYEGTPPTPATSGIGEDARPRSLGSGPANIDALTQRAAPVTHRGRLGAGEIDAHGHARHEALVGRFSDAAPHLWERLGATQPWLAENGYGRVALEMKVTQGAPCPPGPIELRSAPFAVGGKTLSFFHVVTATDSGAVIAAGEVTALLFDRNLRRAIALPARIREKAEAALAG